jgi:hypothetical protein
MPVLVREHGHAQLRVLEDDDLVAVLADWSRDSRLGPLDRNRVTGASSTGGAAEGL